jgi:hypothetical protein
MLDAGIVMHYYRLPTADFIKIITKPTLPQLHIHPRGIQQIKNSRIRVILLINDLAFVFYEAIILNPFAIGIHNFGCRNKINCSNDMGCKNKQ